MNHPAGGFPLRESLGSFSHSLLSTSKLATRTWLGQTNRCSFDRLVWLEIDGFHWFRVVLCPMYKGNPFFLVQKVTCDLSSKPCIVFSLGLPSASLS